MTLNERNGAWLPPVGSAAVERNATLSKTCWYWAALAPPDRVNLSLAGSQLATIAVPAVSALNTSPSPAKVPPEIVTIAPAIAAASARVSCGSTASAAPPARYKGSFGLAGNPPSSGGDTTGGSTSSCVSLKVKGSPFRVKLPNSLPSPALPATRLLSCKVEPDGPST